MRRQRGWALVTALVLVLLSVTVLAIEPNEVADDYDLAFRSQLRELDGAYDLDVSYMIYRVGAELYSFEEAEQNGFQPKAVDREDFEAVLYRFFAPSKAELGAIRAACGYDAESGVYAVQYDGGSGVSLAPRRYLGYLSVGGGIYEVYWQTIRYLSLDTTDAKLMSDLEAAGWPSIWMHKGVYYRLGPTGYVAVDGYDESGRCYRVTVEGGDVRLLSCRDFGPSEMPTRLDHEKQVVLRAPEGISLIGAADVFPDRTPIAIKALSYGAELDVLRDLFPGEGEWSIYDLTAEAEPSGAYALAFRFPAPPESLLICRAEGADWQECELRESEGGEWTVALEKADERIALRVKHPIDTAPPLPPPDTSGPDEPLPPPSTEPPVTTPPQSGVIETDPVSTAAPVTVPPPATVPSPSIPPSETLPEDTSTVPIPPKSGCGAALGGAWIWMMAMAGVGLICGRRWKRDI